MSIKAIFFDTSDTLYTNVDFQEAQENQFVIKLSQEKNVSLEKAEELFNAKKKELTSILPHVTKVAVMEQFGVSRTEMQEFLARIDAKKFLSADKKLDAIIKQLQEIYHLGIITNVSDKLLFNILDALHIQKEYFQYIVSVDNTEKSKPDPEPFLKAIELCGYKPEEIAYAGDSLTKDMIPAKKEGMKTIWVSEKAKEEENVDAFIHSIYDIEKAITTLQ